METSLQKTHMWLKNENAAPTLFYRIRTFHYTGTLHHIGLFTVLGTFTRLGTIYPRIGTRSIIVRHMYGENI